MTIEDNVRVRPRAAVMADVAKLAGVSHQTVSRVINGSEHVKGDTRERRGRGDAHARLSAELGRARAGHRKSRTLGVVSFDTTLYGPASTVFGIERAAHQAGYFISIVSLVSLDRNSVLNAVERLRIQGVDGILVIAPQTDAARAVSDLPADLPVVAVEAGPDQGVPVVSGDSFPGAALATQHLLDLGHRTVWHIAGPTDWLEAQQRVAGWRSTLEAAGRTSRRCSSATGAHGRATSSAGASRATRTSPRSSSATTPWRSDCSGCSTRRAASCRPR